MADAYGIFRACAGSVLPCRMRRGLIEANPRFKLHRVFRLPCRNTPLHCSRAAGTATAAAAAAAAAVISTATSRLGNGGLTERLCHAR